MFSWWELIANNFFNLTECVLLALSYFDYSTHKRLWKTIQQKWYFFCSNDPSDSNGKVKFEFSWNDPIIWGVFSKYRFKFLTQSHIMNKKKYCWTSCHWYFQLESNFENLKFGRMNIKSEDISLQQGHINLKLIYW